MHHVALQHDTLRLHTHSLPEPRRPVLLQGRPAVQTHLRAQPRKEQAAATEDVNQQEQEQQRESRGFSAVVQRLLHRAASSLTRGTTTCLACKGRGTCTCPSCNGSGITEKDARQNVMRHTAQKLRSVLHVDRSEYHSDWLTSNRCRRCHGTGLMICPTCNGLGTRHALASMDGE